MGEEDETLTCYNTGCAVKKFQRSNNGDTSCTYHPSVPVFHDGIKRWPCCARSSCDFTTLLSYPGCEKGPHNPVKPQPAPATVIVEENGPSDFPAVIHRPLEKKPVEARVPSESMVKLTSKTSPSLSAALAKLTTNDPQTNPSVSPANVKCQNFGCGIEKSGAGGELADDCLHHPGAPVFHEGLQYWSCCQKKHTDFEKFRNQPGCNSGKHKWSSNDTNAGNLRLANCRFDHFDGPTVLTLNIYAKNSIPDRCTFEANNCTLRVIVVFGAEQNCFEKDFNLFSTIDPARCVVTMAATKIEVKLAKNPLGPWKKIETSPEEVSAENGENS